MAAMQNAGLALEWVRKILGLSWEQAYAEAFAVPAGSQGLTFLPFLTGERTPHMNPNARGEWAGLGLHHERGHLMRSALEGVAFAIREGMEALEANDVAIPEIRLVGGGTADPRWRQLLADVLGRPLLATDVPSASARGAALLGGLAVGVYPNAAALTELSPIPERVAEPQAGLGLETAYRRYRELYKSLKGWFEG
jgi:xylulokinase